MLISILLPSLAGARTLANRIKCQSRIRQHVVAMNNYAAEYNGAFAMAYTAVPYLRCHCVWCWNIQYFAAAGLYDGGGIMECPVQPQLPGWVVGYSPAMGFRGINGAQGWAKKGKLGSSWCPLKIKLTDGNNIDNVAEASQSIAFTDALHGAGQIYHPEGAWNGWTAAFMDGHGAFTKDYDLDGDGQTEMWQHYLAPGLGTPPYQAAGYHEGAVQLVGSLILAKRGL